METRMGSPVEAAIRSTVMAGVKHISSFNRSIRWSTKPNPYLTGVHKPMSGELTLTDLKMTGSIPDGLNGLYVRNGPNPVRMPRAATHHWFVGDGMLHGIRLQDGKPVWYRNRWLRSTRVSEALGEQPAPGRRSPVVADNPNTNVIQHAGKILAISEAGTFPVEVSEQLDTRSHTDLDGTLEKAFTAHFHTDPDTGEMHGVCYQASESRTVWHTVIGIDGKVRRNEPIQVQDGPSIHDCMITPSYVIVMDLPVTFSMRSLLLGDSFPYRWRPQHTARIGLLPREGRGSDIIWCEVEPCYIFHPANAFETEDGKVVMDAAVHARLFAPGAQGPDSANIPLERLTIDPATRSVTRKVIDPEPQEFPRPDERRIGKPYRYAYSVALPNNRDPAFMGDSRIFKHDLTAGGREVRDFGAGRLPGEFVFVPRTPDSAEDDGWLMGYVIDTATDTTDFVILNARDFNGPPQAVVTIPHRIPPGFHGNFMPM